MTLKQTISPNLPKPDEVTGFVRDFTGVGNPFILAWSAALIFGFGSHAFWILILAWVTNESICSLIKYFYFKPRPLAESWNHWWEKIEASSMPSIHASRTMLLAVFTFLDPNIIFSSKLLVIAACLVISWSRVVLGKHYWIDILVGWVIGGFIGLVFGQNLGF